MLSTNFEIMTLFEIVMTAYVMSCSCERVPQPRVLGELFLGDDLKIECWNAFVLPDRHECVAMLRYHGFSAAF